MQNVKYIGGSGKQKTAFSGAGGAGGTGDVVASGNFVQNFIASAFNSAKTLIAKASTGLKMIGDIVTPDSPNDEGTYVMLGQHLAILTKPNGDNDSAYELLGNATCDSMGGQYRYRRNGTASMDRKGSYGSRVGHWFAESGVAGAPINWCQLTQEKFDRFNINPQNLNTVDFVVGVAGDSMGIFSILNTKKINFRRQGFLNPAIIYDYVTARTFFDYNCPIDFAGHMDMSSTGSYIAMLLKNTSKLSIGNINTSPNAPLQITYEDNNTNSVINLLSLVHRAVGTALVGIGGQVVISSERNTCSGTDIVTAIFGGFQDNTDNNSEVFVSNNQNGTTKRIIRGDSKGRVYLSDTMMITPEGGIAILVLNDIGFASVKGYICKASASAGYGVELIATNAPGNIFAIMYESGIANGQNVWVVIHGMADVYTWNGTSNEQIIRSAVTGDATINAGQGMSVASITLLPQLLAKVGVSLNGGAGAGLKRVKLSF